MEIKPNRHVIGEEYIISPYMTVYWDAITRKHANFLVNQILSLFSKNKDILLISSVDSYEKAWDKIREMTGEEEVDLLVRRFIEVEDRNFALFNYVNEQNNEIELLKEQIQQVGL